MTTDLYNDVYSDKNTTSVGERAELPTDNWYKSAYYLGIVYPWAVCAVGVPCNLANVFVIWRKWIMSPPKLYIAVLSVVDCVALTHKLLMIHLPTLGVTVTTGGCRYLEFVIQTFGQLSSWTLVLLSVERAMVIKFPFSRRTICSIRRTIMTLLITTTILFLLNGHFLFTVASHEVTRACVHHEHYRMFISDVWYFVEASVYAFIPFFFLAISNSIIIACMASRIKLERERCHYSQLEPNGKLKKKNKEKGNPNLADNFPAAGTATVIPPVSTHNNNNQMNLRNSHQSPAGQLMSRQYRKITRSTLLASIAFFLLTVPYCVTMMSFKYFPPTSSPSSRSKLLFVSTLVHALRDVTHAVNFFVYALPTSNMLKCTKFRSSHKRNNTFGMTTGNKIGSGRESLSMRTSATCDASKLFE